MNFVLVVDKNNNHNINKLYVLFVLYYSVMCDNSNSRSFQTKYPIIILFTQVYDEDRKLIKSIIRKYIIQFFPQPDTFINGSLLPDANTSCLHK